MKKKEKGGVKNERKRERRGEGETVCGRESKQVAEDVLEWVVQKKTRQGATQGEHEEERAGRIARRRSSSRWTGRRRFL